MFGDKNKERKLLQKATRRKLTKREAEELTRLMAGKRRKRGKEPFSLSEMLFYDMLFED